MGEKKVIIIGYSGHGYVVCGILHSAGRKVTGYCDKEEKQYNPFSLQYYGSEKDDSGMSALRQNDFFISVGDNLIRKKIYSELSQHHLIPINAIHSSAIVSPAASIKNEGVMISAGVIINPLVKIGTGVICNTGAIIEHECMVGDFTHIGPGAVLCGNVEVGENTFIGANSVLRENIKIGKNVMIGGGSVVVKDIPDGARVMGNPAGN